MARKTINNPKFQYVDSAGEVLDGGKLFTYDAGTVTPRATYSDSTLVTPHANPIILDSNGEATIYGTGLYKLVLRTSADVEVWTEDDISASELDTGLFTTVDTIADLRTIDGTAGTTTALVSGYYAGGDGGGGDFYWDALSTDADNGGTIIKATAVATGRWERFLAANVSVRWFGAKGDGSTDDIAAIQAAIDVGGTTYFPIGTYKITSTLMMPDSSFLLGENTADTIIVHDPTIAKFDMINNSGTTGFRIENLFLQGNGPTVGWSVGDGAGVRFTGASKIFISNIRCFQNSSYGVELANSYDFIVKNSWFERVGDDGVSVSSTTLGGVGGRGVITNNFAYDMRAEGGTETGTGFEVDDGPSQVIITNNIARDCITGFDCHTHIGETDPNSLIFTGNVAVSNEVGLNIFWFGGDGLNSGVNVSNNILRDNTLYGIACISGRHITIDSNHIFNNGTIGLYIDSAADIASRNQEVRDLVISNNNIYDNGAEGISFTKSVGVLLCKRSIITGNTVYGNGKHGIFLNTMQFCTVADNIFSSNGTLADDTYANIKVESNCASIFIHDNQCLWGGGANRVRYGLQVVAGSVSASCYIKNNYIDNARTATILNDGGSPTRVLNNMGFSTENSGIVTLLNGTAAIVVNHGLDITPDITNISVTPNGAWGAATSFWVDAASPNATTFVIRVSGDPGINILFRWSVTPTRI